MTFRFLHSSDLHLGKRFGNFSEDLRGRLREARHGALERLAGAASENGVSTILLAGDTFDTETPSPDVMRQALAEMRRHSALRWVLLPGNHDSLQAAPLWTALRQNAPDNLLFAVEDQPLQLEKDAYLLPAPCTVRRPGRDLTEWMDGGATPEGAIRIGLAHGAIRNFSEDSNGADIIAPDRSTKAGLDYLALGDWHGSLCVDAHTYYSGTPEPDRFKHDRPGSSYIVSIAAPGAIPDVSTVLTGSFLWQRVQLPLLSSDEAADMFNSSLLSDSERRQALIRIMPTGRATLAGRTRLAAAIDHLKPEFALLELDETDLTIDCADDDLDLIDTGGALREAANRLLAESTDEASSLSDRAVAGAALARLFSYCQQVGS